MCLPREFRELLECGIHVENINTDKTCTMLIIRYLCTVQCIYSIVRKANLDNKLNVLISAFQ